MPTVIHLFFLYTKSLCLVIKHHGFSYHCCTDDITLLLSSTIHIAQKRSDCFSDMSSWMKTHIVKLKLDKNEENGGNQHGYGHSSLALSRSNASFLACFLALGNYVTQIYDLFNYFTDKVVLVNAILFIFIHVYNSSH